MMNHQQSELRAEAADFGSTKNKIAIIVSDGPNGVVTFSVPRRYAAEIMRRLNAVPTRLPDGVVLIADGEK